MDFVVLVPFVLALYFSADRLALSSLVNRTIADQPFPIELGVQMHVSPAKVGRNDLMTVAAIVLGMTAVLAALVALLKVFPFVLAYWFAAAASIMLSLLFGFYLNPSARYANLLVGVVAAIALVAVQRMFPSWLTTNVLGALVCLAGLISLRMVPVRGLTLASLGLLIYDAYNVYVSGQMMALADGVASENVAMMIAVPSTVALDAESLLQVGLADVLVPGLWAMAAFRLGREHNTWRLAATTMAGIAVGWVATYTIFSLTNHPVPALLPLLPFTATGYFITAIPRRIVDTAARAA